MQVIPFRLLFSIALICSSSISYSVKNNLDQEILSKLNDYLLIHKKNEKLTAIAVGISYPGSEIKEYYAGKISNKKNAKPLTKENLFQIGSITKSYTSIIILDLEKEGILNINQTIGDWLPDYPKWKKIRIKQLLNMTSTIPGYVTVPELAIQINKNIYRQWTNKEIVDLVYQYPHATKGFDYSDTNYLILAMIIEKATKESFEQQLQKRLLRPYLLTNTFYYVKPYPEPILSRLVHGYYYGKTTGNLRSGADVTKANMSMGGAAGAIIANMHDLVEWIKLLFSGEMLAPNQQKELKQLVSLNTGKFITKISKENPKGFGLGIWQILEPEIGKIWFYGADTPGHSAIYLMNECNQVIVAIAFNSSPFVDTQSKGYGGDLLLDIYKTILKNRPELYCKEDKDIKSKNTDQPSERSKTALLRALYH